ncbi:hypothetical protein [Xanthomonas prunicola]|uniref:hypothetical protein n=1 Tax=Xanthomonas prunicola TaxID=2053930 RepID=UPI001056DBBF|nr:hypothetical protein [Xanthomonas prunicola]
MMPTDSENEPGVALGLGLILILAALLLATLMSGFQTGPIRPGPSAVFLGLYLMAWGTMFLASYFYSDKTFFFRGLIWVCEHWSSPKGRGMAFFYAALALLLGGMVTLSGLGVIGVAA